MKVALKNQYLKKRNGAIYSCLVTYYQKSDLDKDSAYEDYERVAKGFIDVIGKSKLSKITSSEFDMEDYVFNFTDEKKPGERFYWLFNFQNLYRALNNVIEGYSPRHFNTEGAERQTVLKKEAFRYIGHNETKIKHSKSSYSLLFE